MNFFQKRFFQAIAGVLFFSGLGLARADQVTAGSTVVLSVSADGTSPFTYQWIKDGINMPGSTGPTLTLAKIQSSNAGNYAVTVANAAGSTTSDISTISVLPGTAAPVITTQPSSQSAIVGSNVTFTSAASGTPAPTYQWEKNGTAISGATSSTLVLSGVKISDGSTYTVVATNSAGSTTSTGAALTVSASTVTLVITTQPLSQSATVGANVTFTVAASGTPAPTFQWKKNGAAILGATGAILTISDIQASAAGMYTVVASNNQGSVSSVGANLRVAAATYPNGFDAVGYLVRNPDVAAVVGNDLNAAWLHYWTYGLSEGRVFDDVFRVEEYVGLYGDLQAAYGHNLQKILMHWLNYGRGEGRLGRVPVTFDTDGYLANNSDLQVAFHSLTDGRRKAAEWNHYLDYGIKEGRTDGDFNVREYLAEYGDLQAAFGKDLEAAAWHWYFYGRYEGRRIPVGFDVQGYLARNSDVKAAYGRDLYGAWLHYFNYGINEGRVFDDFFRVDAYLALYPDLRAAFGTDRQAALMHWLRYGKAEGRRGR